MSHDQKRQIASVRASYYYQRQQTAAAADANKPSTSECFTRARWFNSISLHTSRATPPPDHTGLTPSPSTPAPERGYPTPDQANKAAAQGHAVPHQREAVAAVRWPNKGSRKKSRDAGHLRQARFSAFSSGFRSEEKKKQVPQTNKGCRFSSTPCAPKGCGDPEVSVTRPAGKRGSWVTGHALGFRSHIPHHRIHTSLSQACIRNNPSFRFNLSSFHNHDRNLKY